MGRLSDRIGRRPFLAAVLALSTMAPVLMALHETLGAPTLFVYFPTQASYHSFPILCLLASRIVLRQVRLKILRAMTFTIKDVHCIRFTTRAQSLFDQHVQDFLVPAGADRCWPATVALRSVHFRPHQCWQQSHGPEPEPGWPLCRLHCWAYHLRQLACHHKHLDRGWGLLSVRSDDAPLRQGVSVRGCEAEGKPSPTPAHTTLLGCHP